MLSKALLDANVASCPGNTSQNGLQGHLQVTLHHMLDLMGPIFRLNEAVSIMLTLIMSTFAVMCCSLSVA